MMIVMTPHATPEQIDSILEHIKSEGFQPHRSDGKEQTVIGVVGIVDRDVDPRQFEVLDGVAKVVRISSPTSSRRGSSRRRTPSSTWEKA